MLSKEDYNKIVYDEKYYDCDEGEYDYLSLEDEFEHRKQIQHLEDVAEVSLDTFKEKLTKGFTPEEALQKTDSLDKHRFYMDSHFMTRAEHCNRLYISLGRVEGKMSKHNLTFEDACKLPIDRITRHAINGVIKRNSEWAIHFNIHPRSFNSVLSKKKSFRKALGHYNVDTSGMEIFPCDGDVIMYNNPL